MSIDAAEPVKFLLEFGGILIFLQHGNTVEILFVG